ncbi:MAG: hypothetical protein R2856_10715 [Caldilineaceae bacterium]
MPKTSGATPRNAFPWPVALVGPTTSPRGRPRPGRSLRGRAPALRPDLMDELRGIADATGLSLAELVIANGFTDFVDTVYTYAHQQQETALVADDCTASSSPIVAPSTVTACSGRHGTCTPRPPST